MPATTNLLTEPRMTAAIAELTELIRERYPDTTFTTELGENEEAVFVTAVVDVDEPDEVVDCYIDRSVTLLVDEGLPLHVIPVRTPAREAQLLANLRSGRSTGIGPRSATG
jgi:hypothetical protein